MNEKRENRCWDCPSRTGISRVCGKLAFKFWNSNDFSDTKISKQRGECSGPVPARYISQGSGAIEEGEDIVTRTTVWHDVYLASCPKEFSTPPESPEAVKTAMRVNHLMVFTDERIETSTESRAEYDQHRDQLLERFEQIRTQQLARE